MTNPRSRRPAPPSGDHYSVRPYPQQAVAERGALEAKLLDLHPVVKNCVYHPDFRGSFSLKYILTPLVPELTYSDLVIVDGRVASVEKQDPAPRARSSYDRPARLLRAGYVGDGPAARGVTEARSMTKAGRATRPSESARRAMSPK